MTGWPHCAAPITVHSSISSSRLVKKGTMKTLIVLAALFGFSAAYVDFSKVPEQVLLQTMEGFQYPHYSGAPCVNETFASCQKIFNNNLNISSNADWTDPNEFLRQLNAVLQRGVTTGLVPLCNAWQQLYNCLGTSYYSCFNPVYLISQGTGLQPAFQFTAEILRTQFKCVGGFEQSVKKYDCIISGFQNTNAIDQCLATWNQTLNNNFNQLCQATQNLTTCFMNIFASCGNEVQWWICEDVRVGFSLFNCPDLRCYVPQASGQLRSDYQDVDNQEMTEEDLKQALAGVSYKIMAARNSIPRIPHDSL